MSAYVSSGGRDRERGVVMEKGKGKWKGEGAVERREDDRGVCGCSCFGVYVQLGWTV